MPIPAASFIAHTFLSQSTPWIGPAFESVSSVIAATYVSSVWQGLAIAFSLSLCLAFSPRISAASRFAVWAAGFVVTACLAALPLQAHFAAGQSAGVLASSVLESSKPLLVLDPRWSFAIVGSWVAASLIRGLDLAIQAMRLRSLWKSATPIEVSEGLAARIAASKRSRIAICSTKALERPSAIGFFAPRILIPDWLLERLTPVELEQVVLHEAEHLRRMDDWTNLLQKLLMVAFPLNPALWWMERKLCREREMACDEGVVHLTHAPRAYAACLASLAERGLKRRAEALSLGAWQKRSELVHRVHGILLRKRMLSPIGTYALVGTLGCGLVAGSVELARCPEMVAFVPAKKAERSQLAAKVAQDAGAAAIEGDTMAIEGSQRVPGFHAVTTKALIPTESGARWTAGHAQPKGGRLNAAVARLEGRLPEMAKVATPVASVHSEERSHWIVFTAEERVQTTDGRGQLIADYVERTCDDCVMDDVQGAWSKAAGPATDQVTITRLILRILPEDSVSTRPDAAAARGGWFVIQL